MNFNYRPNTKILIVGDEKKAGDMRKQAFNQLDLLIQGMTFNNLQQNFSTRTFDDGSYITCKSTFGQNYIVIYSPKVGVSKEEQKKEIERIKRFISLEIKEDIRFHGIVTGEVVTSDSYFYILYYSDYGHFYKCDNNLIPQLYTSNIQLNTRYSSIYLERIVDETGAWKSEGGTFIQAVITENIRLGVGGKIIDTASYIERIEFNLHDPGCTTTCNGQRFMSPDFGTVGAAYAGGYKNQDNYLVYVSKVTISGGYVIDEHLPRSAVIGSLTLNFESKLYDNITEYNLYNCTVISEVDQRGFVDAFGVYGCWYSDIGYSEEPAYMIYNSSIVQSGYGSFASYGFLVSANIVQHELFKIGQYVKAQFLWVTDEFGYSWSPVLNGNAEFNIYTNTNNVVFTKVFNSDSTTNFPLGLDPERYATNLVRGKVV